jgi:hypothetical protein
MANIDPKKEEQVQEGFRNSINLLNDAKNKIDQQNDQLSYKTSVDILNQFSDIVELRLQLVIPYLQFGYELSNVASKIKEERKLLSEQQIRKDGHDPDSIFNALEFDRPVDYMEATFNIILTLEKEYSDNLDKLSTLTGLIAKLNTNETDKFKIMLEEFIRNEIIQIDIARNLYFDCLYYIKGFDKNANIIISAYEIILDRKSFSALSNH